MSHFPQDAEERIEELEKSGESRTNLGGMDRPLVVTPAAGVDMAMEQRAEEAEARCAEAIEKAEEMKEQASPG